MTTSGPCPVEFEEVARGHARNVQEAYRELLAAHGDPDEVSEIAAALQVDVETAWRLRRLTDALDPLMAVECVPSEADARAILRGALEAGGSSASADLLLACTRAFEGFVERNFDTRAAFERRAADLVGRDVDAIMLESRRAAYRANVMIEGRRAECSIHVCGLGPGTKPGHYSSFGALGHVELQRIHRDASTLVGRQRFREAETEGSSIAPLDPEGMRRFRSPLIRRFASPNLESSLRWRTDGDHVVCELDERATGPASAFTYISGYAVENYAPSPQEHLVRVRVKAGTPMKRLVVNALVHDGVPHTPADFRVATSGSRGGEWPDADAPENLAQGCVLEDLGSAATARVGSSVWSREDELVDYTLERMGWDPASMRRYRLVVVYPVLYSTVTLRCEEAPPPGVSVD